MTRANPLCHALACLLLPSCAGSATEPEEPPSQSILIAFPALYSSFGGTQTYSVTPYVVMDKADPIVHSTLAWHWDTQLLAAAENMTDLDGAIALTTQHTGKTDITFTAKTVSGSKLRGSSTLTIGPADDELWALGDARYRDGPRASFVIMDRFGGAMEPEEKTCEIPSGSLPKVPEGTACASCHSDDAASPASEPTPTQTAGYDDDELIAIFTDARKPQGYRFTSPLLRMAPEPDCLYEFVHAAPMPEETARGLVLKLRSLPPRAAPEVDRAKVEELLGADGAAGSAGR